MVWLKADCDTPSWAAARVKLRSRATTMKADNTPASSQKCRYASALTPRPNNAAASPWAQLTQPACVRSFRPRASQVRGCASPTERTGGK